MDDEDDGDESPVKKDGLKSQSPTPTVEQYQGILNEATKWQAQLEVTRDDMYLLQIKNAVLLDNLTMAGADV